MDAVAVEYMVPRLSMALGPPRYNRV